ncbi:hypothetical protein GCM10011418_11510 [Sphingobacterium alkalisoli]|nr:hypothetical protein GCM10011418_11510 [Sphingobacterium alkalisoli]
MLLGVGRPLRHAYILSDLPVYIKGMLLIVCIARGGDKGQLGHLMDGKGREVVAQLHSAQ